MVNGRYDRTITSLQAERLFEAAREPKEIHWYQGGHWPPPREIDFAAEWLSARLSALGTGSSKRAKSVGAE